MCICICMYIRTNMWFIDQETSLVDTICFLGGKQLDSKNKKHGDLSVKNMSLDGVAC